MVNLDTLNFDQFTSSGQRPSQSSRPSQPYMTPPSEPTPLEACGSGSGSTSKSGSGSSSSTSLQRHDREFERPQISPPIERPILHTPAKYARVQHTVNTSADLAALFRSYIRALNMKSFSTLRLFLSPTCTCNGAKWNSDIIQDMIAPVSTRHSTGTIVMLVADISQRVVATRLQLQYQSNANIIEFDNLFYRYDDQWLIEEIRGNLPWNERVDHTIQEKRSRRRHRNLPSPQQSAHYIQHSPQTSPETNTYQALAPPS
ncbi:hypothetical protein A1Q2_04121 [Trichosporon asahii var. asahii CBS 8904]|uniref:Uncharacterized protein n=1 Tax=Trichosporon asahii var. asahii (strain CBS 8904) TaxID=1220162 RepID=K1VC46_TRIAC|nr:hypothetical protein A1Q2_04121 [Trichosporon asahii var. asahii CBS 8904]